MELVFSCSGDFSVSLVKKLIDNAILPKGISKTRWIKEVPIKINVHDEGSANPTDPHHTPTIIQPSTSQPQKTKQHRKPKRKVTEVPLPSEPTKHVADEAVNKEVDGRLERAVTTATELVQRGLHAQVRIIRTDKGMEFLNKTLHAYLASERINHQTSVARTPEQNGNVKIWNRTLVEAP
nr:putative RNA-directed DNA polymerase [Tanacetum cinerariifolium]